MVIGIGSSVERLEAAQQIRAEVPRKATLLLKEGTIDTESLRILYYSLNKIFSSLSLDEILSLSSSNASEVLETIQREIIDTGVNELIDRITPNFTPSQLVAVIYGLGDFLSSTDEY